MSDSLKILLSEDNPGDRRLISESLVTLNPSIDTVQSGREAFRELERNDYDIILLDYSLPALNGLEVLDLFSEKGVDIPVIMITGQGDEHIAAESIKRGAHDYVLKSELSRLVFSISSGIERFKEKQELVIAESKLRQSEDLVQNIQVGLYIYHLEDSNDDRTLRMIYTNRAAAEMTGVSIVDVIGKTLDENFPGLREKGIPQQYADVVRTGIPVELDDVYYGVARDIQGWYKVNAFPLPDNCVGVSFENITERKKAEEKLTISEHKLTIQYKIASIFLSVSDEEMYHEVLKVILEAMESQFGVFGYIDEKGDLVCPSLTRDVWDQCQMTEKEIVFPKETWGNTIWAHALKMNKGSLSNTQSSVPEGHIPISKALIIPITYRNESIGIFMLANKVSDYTAADQKLLETIAEQVAPVLHERLEKGRHEKERIRLEEQLIQSQKMESIGRLAGGIAHDFNNILTAIIGNADLSLLSITPDDSLYEELNEIKIGAERAANLTSQLLAFSRRQIIAPRIVNLNTLLLRIDNMLRRLIGEDIELVMVPGTNLWKILVDQGQIEQILTNLVVNARDAMPGGGKITIETANIVLDDESDNLQTAIIPGDYVMMTVTDIGLGMDEETQKHIFEPFFTTKEISKGTGLGLSTCYGIVKQNNGYIWAISEVGNGSSFKVYFPENSGSQEMKPANSSVDELPKGTESILVVEDEIAVCRMIVRTLKKCGYTVINASNGEEAISVSEQYDNRIHLLITDVVMPRMGGKELSANIRNIYPETKVLFMSGYTDEPVSGPGIMDREIDFLQKPFSPVVIARKVREVLDKKD